MPAATKETEPLPCWMRLVSYREINQMGETERGAALREIAERLDELRRYL
jgi:hypothetical protein